MPDGQLTVNPAANSVPQNAPNQDVWDNMWLVNGLAWDRGSGSYSRPAGSPAQLTGGSSADQASTPGTAVDPALVSSRDTTSAQISQGASRGPALVGAVTTAADANKRKTLLGQ